ncbi:Uncharacterised protein [Legionella beliardensis]|uniref:Uncharacterized protein n=1 Tax=Legionella beliardensis TaxID=91822 RepID=A0A378I114_9GAMM|nr:hypothetical protein [Legionella beliardensis]STX28839.1 Uncharacterised protein [Legionella beliardensis]
MKTILFLVSSIGDTDLALKTIKALEQKKSNYKTSLISLTKAATLRIENFQSASLTTKVTLPEILSLPANDFPQEACSDAELHTILQYIKDKASDYAYVGVPSVSSKTPFQIAERLTIPALIAYEFMFKPENHSLWDYLPNLEEKPNLSWAIPLAQAKEDFPRLEHKSFITGHLSIDNSYQAVTFDKSKEEIAKALHVLPEQSYAFISSTTQPVEIDADFLDCLLSELKSHPGMQVRLGLHPGIANLDAYLTRILAICAKYPQVGEQFKIILPDNLLTRLKTPELTIDNDLYRHLFLRVNITGAEAAYAADRVTQAVPGALLNQAVIEGKPTYSHRGKSYLPQNYFSTSLNSFFNAKPNKVVSKEELGLDDKTAPEKYADLIMNSVKL